MHCATTRCFDFAQHDNVVASNSTWLILCHSERSKAKPKNLITLAFARYFHFGQYDKQMLYATTRCFDLAQHDNVVANNSTWLMLCHSERNEV